METNDGHFPAAGLVQHSRSELDAANEFSLRRLCKCISEALRKPRNRSEWEARFAYWQKSASNTEEAEITAVARRVRRAFAHSKFLPTRRWTIVEQGSYRNNTNIRAGSDVDLCVCLTDAYFVDGPSNDRPSSAELALEPMPFQFEEFRAHIAWCLSEEFGSSAITTGKKAIHLHKNDNERINADVVPAYEFLQFGPRLAPTWQRGVPHVGIAFQTTEGIRVTNFPQQHYINGCGKNDRTGRRYKRVVRIIKQIRDHMAENTHLPPAARARAKNTASFLIESLVFNCPDERHFQHESIYDDVVAVLNYLSHCVKDRRSNATILGAPAWAWWTEVNGVKDLFSHEQAWTIADAAEFIEQARSYMGV